jgi:hypothetical protein
MQLLTIVILGNSLSRSGKKWDEVAPGYKCPINFTPAQCEEHAEANAYWSEHLGYEHSLRAEFSLGDFGIVLVNPPAMDGTPDHIFPHTSHISCYPSFQTPSESSSFIGGARCLQTPSCAMCTIRKCQHLTPLLHCYHLHLVPRPSTDDDSYVSSKGLAAERDFLALSSPPIMPTLSVSGSSPTCFPSRPTSLRSSSSETFRHRTRNYCSLVAEYKSWLVQEYTL